MLVTWLMVLQGLVQGRRARPPRSVPADAPPTKTPGHALSFNAPANGGPSNHAPSSSNASLDKASSESPAPSESPASSGSPAPSGSLAPSESSAHSDPAPQESPAPLSPAPTGSMGGLLSYITQMVWGPPEPQVDRTPDPATGLSAYDRQLITETWALAADKKTRKANGVEFFIQLFRAYPYMLNYFPAFKDLPEAEMRNSPKLKAHALSVMFAIGSLVATLDDAEGLVGLVNKLAVSHVARDVKAKQFQELAEMFIPFLESLLGPLATEDVKAAWTRLLAAQTALVTQAQAEVENEA